MFLFAQVQQLNILLAVLIILNSISQSHTFFLELFYLWC
jgi:hypothetical protein